MSDNDRVRVEGEATWALLVAFLDRFAEDAPAEVRAFAATAIVGLRVAGKEDAAKLVESYAFTLPHPVSRKQLHT